MCLRARMSTIWLRAHTPEPPAGARIFWREAQKNSSFLKIGEDFMVYQYAGGGRGQRANIWGDEIIVAKTL